MGDPKIEILKFLPYLILLIVSGSLLVIKNNHIRKWWFSSCSILSVIMLVTFLLFMIGDDIGITVFSDQIRTTGYSYFFGAIIIQFILALNTSRDFTEEKNMIFINEYISEEDIKKYGIEKLFLDQNPVYLASGMPNRDKQKWTKNVENNIYLMQLKIGKHELSNRSVWIFYIDKRELEVTLEHAEGSSLSYKEVPYRVVWDLIKIRGKVNNKDETIKALKEALTMYGDKGIDSYVDNVQVIFNF